jgi:hypothetical protein
MMIKALSGVLCGLLVACGGAVQAPVTRVATVDSCDGGAVHDTRELARFRGCSRINGSLAVSGVDSLEALSALESVAGSLSLSDTRHLESLAGLEHLSAVGGLELRDNRALSDLSQLTRLHRAQQVVIQGNQHLRNLDGLSGLSELQNLSLVGTALYSLRGLENLTQIDRLELSDNTSLIDPSALNGVSAIREVIVEHNPRLCSTFGFLPKIEHAAHVAMAGNIGLERSHFLRLRELQSQGAVAVR